MPGRAYVAGNFEFLLDGVKCGFLKSVDGGAAVAEVVSVAAGSSRFPDKHLGRISYSPFVLQFGPTMGKEVYDWINASWTKEFQRRNGAIAAADSTLTVVSQREFVNALFTELTIPALDGTSKDPAYFTLKISPEYTKTVKASGKMAAPDKRDQKLWLPSNFRVAIDGLDCTRVSRVDSFTVTQSVASEDLGETRLRVKAATRLEFPNLTITLAETAAESWLDWFDDFVIKGNSGESNEKNGSISLLAANLADELLRIDLYGLGIFKIGPERTEANSDKIATVTAHLYCERMELHAAGGPA